MQTFELTLSQTVSFLLQSSASTPASEIDRLTHVARDLELGQTHISKIDSGDLVVLADLLEKNRPAFPQLADWAGTFNEEYSRRIHTRSNC